MASRAPTTLWLGVGGVLLALVAAISGCCTSRCDVLATPLRPIPRRAGPGVVVTFSSKLHPRPYTGRVWIVSARGPKATTAKAPRWVRPDPFLSTTVKHWRPGHPRFFPLRSPGYPKALGDWPPGTYRLRAVMDLAPAERLHPRAEGNGYSADATWIAPVPPGRRVFLHIDRRVTPKPPRADPRVTFVHQRSALLSGFHGHAVEIRAAVFLPRALAQVPKPYPAVYYLTGFSSKATLIRRYTQNPPQTKAPFAYVVIAGNCRRGHHLYVDSPTNGPWGRAVVSELLPALERRFGLQADGHGRFLVGASSGGWGALWLQLQYPRVFGGAWAIAPDPVDFRHFLGADLHAPGANLFRDAAGKPRPLMQMGGRVLATVRQYVRFEEMLGGAGPIHTFNAAWSPRVGRRPRPLFDPRTGAVDPVTVRAWRRYELARVIPQRWATQRADLAGKLHIIVGDADQFGLHHPVRLLQTDLDKAKIPVDITIVPGAGHDSIHATAAARRIYQQMSTRWRRR